MLYWEISRVDSISSSLVQCRSFLRDIKANTNCLTETRRDGVDGVYSKL